FYIVDVFTDERYSGNQLAVVFPASPLDEVQMQAVAREFNFSETTFVETLDDGSANVRIFTPGIELPFAGHPTLGTAWILARVTGHRDEVELHLKAGDVPVVFREEVGWLQPPAPTFDGELAHADVAAAAGLPIDRLNASLPVVRADVGPRFVLVPLNDERALAELRIDAQAWDERVGGDHGLFLFAPMGPAKANGVWQARMLSTFLGSEVREDPATGSANACFAEYLRVNLGAPVDATVHQGVEMGRASTLYLRAGERLEVGGKVVLVASGELG
ncbi:MAG: PhzF family phenazine biosynthesis protein, partial [Gammaproteobacteria bacterium]